MCRCEAAGARPTCLSSPLPTPALPCCCTSCSSLTRLPTVPLGLCTCHSRCMEHPSCPSPPTHEIPLDVHPAHLRMGRRLLSVPHNCSTRDSLSCDFLIITASRGCLAFSEHIIPSFLPSFRHSCIYLLIKRMNPTCKSN